MAFGIFATAQQAGFHQGQNWERKNNTGAEKTAAAGVGVAVAGLAALAQAKREAAAYQALAQKLKDIIAQVAPNHPMATAAACNAEFEKAYNRE